MNKSLVALGLASGLALAAPAYAQQSAPPAGEAAKPMNTQTMGAQTQRPQAGAKDKAMEGRRAVVGKVVDTRTVQIKGPKGQTAEHRLVKLQNKANKVVIVDLGIAQRAPDPKKGETFVALGKEARINGRPVLLASFAGELEPAGGLMAKK